MNPRPTPELLSRFYQEHYPPHYARQEWTAPRIPEMVYRLWQWLDGQPSLDIIRKSGKALDVGCGVGMHMELLRSKGMEVEGLDANPIAVEIARRRGLRVFLGGLEEARYPDNEFDVLLMSHVIEHVPSPADLLREAWRILRPAGRLCITCPNFDFLLRPLFGSAWKRWHPPFHLYHFTSATLGRLLEETGFAHRITTCTPGWELWLDWTLWWNHRKGAPRAPRNGSPRRWIRLAMAPAFRVIDRLGSGLYLRAVARKQPLEPASSG